MSIKDLALFGAARPSRSARTTCCARWSAATRGRRRFVRMRNKRRARTAASCTTSSASASLFGQPARIVERRVQVRQDDFLKGSVRHRLRHRTGMARKSIPGIIPPASRSVSLNGADRTAGGRGRAIGSVRIGDALDAIRINHLWRICIWSGQRNRPTGGCGTRRFRLWGHMPPGAIHPGEHLAVELRALNMSAAELARRINVPRNRVTLILHGRRAITEIPRCASQLLRNQSRVSG